jgi:hypothetical protein
MNYTAATHKRRTQKIKPINFDRKEVQRNRQDKNNLWDLMCTRKNKPLGFGPIGSLSFNRQVSHTPNFQNGIQSDKKK